MARTIQRLLLPKCTECTNNLVPCMSKLYVPVADRIVNTGQDHTEFETGENVYMGLDGFYLLRDDEEQALNLPRDAHDIPLSICAKRYGPDGALVYNTNGNTGVWGDVIHVYESHFWRQVRC